MGKAAGARGPPLTATGWAYRTRQALLMWTARPARDSVDAAAEQLPANLQPLFVAMPARDQAHAIRVLERATPSASSPLLTQAALLHDVGKSRSRLGVPGRSLFVLCEAVRARALLTGLPVVGSRFRAYADHAAIGAAMLREAGASQELVDVVAEHHAAAPRLQATRDLKRIDSLE